MLSQPDRLLPTSHDPELRSVNRRAVAKEFEQAKARKPRAQTRKSKEEIKTRDHLPTQMNFWPDEVRGVSNAVLRSALFSICKERAMARKRLRLATVENYLIMVKGELFNQHDLDLWEMLLHIGRRQPYNKHIEFNARDLLKALGRGTGGGDYEELKEDISRLMSTVIEITFLKTKETFSGSLIHNLYRQEATQHYAISFDEELRKLYDTGYTHVDWTQRTKLKGDSLAKWLHGFYASHALPLRYKVATLKELCGSKTVRLTDFRVALRKAFDKLKEVGAITIWDIDPKNDLVTVRRKASMSQQRHLESKQASKTSVEFSSGVSGTLSGFDSHMTPSE